MSELKVWCATIQPKMKNACDGAREVYLKSEADRVINHQKYKRCLAMASNCALQKKKLKLLNLEDDFVEIVKIRAVKIQRWDKWCNRWLSLAGKFDKS